MHRRLLKCPIFVIAMQLAARSTMALMTRNTMAGRGAPRALVRRAAFGVASSAPPQDAFPELCVFDLDACLWDKEMFEMTAVPTEADVVLGELGGAGSGVVSVMSGGERISLHPGALAALQKHANDGFPGMRLAVASSANTPFAEEIARAALELLEVTPGFSVMDLLLSDWDEVSRSGLKRTELLFSRP